MDIPGSPVRIYLNLAVIAGLRKQLFIELDSSSLKETRGSLLGKAQRGRVDITGIHSFSAAGAGLHLALSGTGKENLQNLIRKHQADESLLSVVNYFRNDPRGEILLSNEDLLLIKDSFHDPEHVFLIINGKTAELPQPGSSFGMPIRFFPR